MLRTRSRTRPRPGAGDQPDRELAVTPMIDVVFLLLIFFLLASRFKSTEGEIKSYLPKDRGPGETPYVIDLAEVRIKLLWLDKAGRPTTDPDVGRVVLKVNDHVYPTRLVHDTVTRRNETVPRWEVLLDFLRECNASYRGSSPKGQPVIIDARPVVPWKHVVSTLDRCIQADLEDITFAAPERGM